MHFYFSPLCPNEIISLPAQYCVCGIPSVAPRMCHLESCIRYANTGLFECGRFPGLIFRLRNIQRMVFCPPSWNYCAAAQPCTSSVSSCRWHFVVSVTNLEPSPLGCFPGDSPQCFVYLKALKNRFRIFFLRIYVTHIYTFLVDG